MPSASHNAIDAAAGVSTVVPPHVAFTKTVNGMTVSVDCSASYGMSSAIVLSSWDFGDGGTATGVTQTHTYASAGTYTITYTATQGDGGTASTSQSVTIAAANVAPTASFTSNVTNLVVSVNAAASNDPDGSIATYAWDFGDSSSGTGATTTHTYASSGTYTITLTVTDNDGATDTQTTNVTVSAPQSSTLGDDGGTGVQQTGSGVYAYSNGSGDFSSDVNAVGTGGMSSLPSGTFTFSDFTYNGGGTPPTQFWFGAKITAKGILGAGSNYSTIQMVPNTSTKSSDIPSQGTGSSNQLQYIYCTAAGFKIDGVKIVGTTQGHLYNGLRIQAVASPTLSNTTITSIPGNAGSPPGETFGVNFQACTGTVTVKNVTMDGGGVTAAALGSNSSGATYNITNLYTFNHPYSAGWASWQHTGTMNFYNFVMQNGARAFNAERLAGPVNFYDPVWDQPTSGHSDVNPTYDGGYANGTLNFYFSNTAAWSAFVANRTVKKIMAISNSSSVSQGLVKNNVINVYINNVKQTQSNYVQWSGI